MSYIIIHIHSHKNITLSAVYIYTYYTQTYKEFEMLKYTFCSNRYPKQYFNTAHGNQQESNPIPP